MACGEADAHVRPRHSRPALPEGRKGAVRRGQASGRKDVPAAGIPHSAAEEPRLRGAGGDRTRESGVNQQISI